MTDVRDGGQAAGRRVRALRLAQGWDQTELAKRAGVSPAYVNRLEGGFYKDPSSTHLGRIAAALGTTLAELVEPSAPLPPSLEERLRQLRPDDRAWADEALAVILALPPEQRQEAVDVLRAVLTFGRDGRTDR